MMHTPSQSVVIGPYVIDLAGNVRTIEALLNVRIGGMAKHLTDPDNKVYMLGEQLHPKLGWLTSRALG